MFCLAILSIFLYVYLCSTGVWSIQHQLVMHLLIYFFAYSTTTLEKSNNRQKPQNQIQTPLKSMVTQFRWAIHASLLLINDRFLVVIETYHQDFPVMSLTRFGQWPNCHSWESVILWWDCSMYRSSWLKWITLLDVMIHVHYVAECCNSRWIHFGVHWWTLVSMWTFFIYF